MRPAWFWQKALPMPCEHKGKTMPRITCDVAAIIELDARADAAGHKARVDGRAQRYSRLRVHPGL